MEKPAEINCENPLTDDHLSMTRKGSCKLKRPQLDMICNTTESNDRRRVRNAHPAAFGIGFSRSESDFAPTEHFHSAEQIVIGDHADRVTVHFDHHAADIRFGHAL